MDKSQSLFLKICLVLFIPLIIVSLIHTSRLIITPNNQFFILQKGNVPQIKKDQWILEVNGNVEKNLKLDYNELLAMESKRLIATLDCVEGYYGTAEWEGIPLNILLIMAGVKNGSVDVVFHASDDYTDSLTIEEASAENILLAYKMNGVPLPAEHGFPVRLICPDHYGYKWVKWITRIEVVNYDYIGYWEQRGWNDQAMRTNFSSWIIHAYLFTISFIFGGLSYISGRKFSPIMNINKNLPKYVSRRFHKIFSLLFLFTSSTSYIYWIIATFQLRGSVFYSLHGIVSLFSMILILFASILSIPSFFKSEKGRKYHILIGSWAFYLYLGSILFGILISLIGSYRLFQIFTF